MISTPDLKRRTLAAIGAGALLIAVGAPGLAASSGKAGELIAKAEAALAQGDGIAAEVQLRSALDAGALQEAVAADMGEAYLLQESPDRARPWLEPGKFSRDTAARGFRALARLEQHDGDLAAAGSAFDRAMAITPSDATMWVEIGRLRYAGGEHQLALEAVAHALQLDPKNIRALAFHAQIVRDRQGFAASLRWFEAALALEPKDISVLSEYAATLGDLGRAKEMLAATRRILAIDDRHPQAFYLQAVLAARAGNANLARGLLNRTGKGLETMPGAMLLDGVLQINDGNYLLAADNLQKLVRLQPGNQRARLLLARALYLAGEFRLVIVDNGAAAARSDASPYLLTLVARAHEALGQRDLAAPLLDRAARTERPAIFPVAQGSETGALLAAGNLAEAQAKTARDLAVNPASADLQVLAGDVALMAGDAAGALDHYRRVAHIRLPESLMLRMAAAYRQLGRQGEAAALAARFLREHPMSRTAARMVAANGVGTARARLLLANLQANGGGQDVGLLVSLAQSQASDPPTAEATARLAYRLQPSSLLATEAWRTALQSAGADRGAVMALTEKADRTRAQP
jgi:predicted Zn-dependent protease